MLWILEASFLTGPLQSNRDRSCFPKNLLLLLCVHSWCVCDEHLSSKLHCRDTAEHSESLPPISDWVTATAEGAQISHEPMQTKRMLMSLLRASSKVSSIFVEHQQHMLIMSILQRSHLRRRREGVALEGFVPDADAVGVQAIWKGDVNALTLARTGASTFWIIHLSILLEGLQWCSQLRSLQRGQAANSNIMSPFPCHTGGRYSLASLH